jgi:hypothetical protein
MRRAVARCLALTILLPASVAFAEWSLTNKDHQSYELTRQCGDRSEPWSVAGGVVKRLSIPAGASSCTITMKNGGGSCTVKDGEGCVIQSAKIARQ